MTKGSNIIFLCQCAWVTAFIVVSLGFLMMDSGFKIILSAATIFWKDISLLWSTLLLPDWLLVLGFVLYLFTGSSLCNSLFCFCMNLVCFDNHFNKDCVIFIICLVLLVDIRFVLGTTHYWLVHLINDC